MSETSSSDPHQLILREFIWEHLPTRTVIPFSNGINILHGKTQAERTVILRLVRYALGGSAERIDENILQASDNVILRFTANNEPIQVIRSCQHPSAQFELQDNEGKHFVNPSEMSRLLIDKLHLPKIYLPTTRPDGARAEKPVSFNDFARAFVVDRDISYSEIMAGAFDKVVFEVVKVMMGLTTAEVADAENKIRTYDAKITDLKHSIVSVQNFLKTLNVPTLVEIQARRQVLAQALEKLREQEEQLRTATQRRIDQGSVRHGGVDYDTLRTELLAKRAEFDEKQRDSLNLSRQITEKNELRVLLESEAERIERHISSHHVVSTFLFSQCPRCMQSITQDMMDREKEGHCMLCNREFRIDDSQAAGWEKALRDARQMIHEVDTLVQDYRFRETKTLEELGPLAQRIAQIETGLNRQAAEYIAPIVEQIQLNSLERISIERESSQLDYEQRQRELAIQYELVDLPKFQSELEGLQQQLAELKAKVGKSSDHYNAFLTHFRGFLQSVDLDQKVERVEWDEKNQLPKINGQQYKIMIGFDMVVTVLGFHYALLAMGVREPAVKTSHPKLLLVDEPEQQKMGKTRYHQILAQFSALGIEHSDASQIIITTDTRDIPTDLEKYSFMI